MRRKSSTEGGKRIVTITKLTPIEISLVPIPADPAAVIRGDSTMPGNVTAGPSVENRAAINIEIRSIAKTLGLPQTFVDSQIDAGASIDAVRAAAIDALAKRSPNLTYATASISGHDANDPAWRSRAIGGAITARMIGQALAEESREFAGLSLVEMCRDLLKQRGLSTLGSAGVIVERALTSSDFPALMSDAANRSMRLRYEAVPSALKKVAKQITAPDFRTIHKIQLSSAPTLLPVNEAGEITRGGFVDSQETMKLGTFARIVNLSRQVIINDDLGAFSDMTMRMGQAAAAFEAKQLVAALESPPVMSDGLAVFHATHGNLAGSGAVISETTLTAARVALRTQTDQVGELIAATPKYFVVPPQLETLAQKTISSVQATQTSNVNTFTFLELLVESRLSSATAYYLFADPQLIDGLCYAYLQGSEGPQLYSEIGFDTSGISYKIEEDFAAAWTESRGVWKNPGA